jgi:hypothetical protein
MAKTREQKRLERKQLKSKMRAQQYAAAAARKASKGQVKVTRNVKQNGYQSDGLKAKQAQKRKDAQLRQRKYDKLTTQERVQLAQGRRGESKREIARLTKPAEPAAL